MGHSRDDDFPHGDVFTSESYRQDAINAVVYSVTGVVLFVCAVGFLAFLDSPSGSMGAQGVAETTPLSQGQATFVGRLSVYFVLAVSAISFLVVGYSGVVRPLQRASGLLAHTGGEASDGSRAAIDVETVDGVRTFQLDAACVDCEEAAIGVVSTAFEDATPGEVVPVCPMHLHERRDELEARGERVEVETFV